MSEQFQTLYPEDPITPLIEGLLALRAAPLATHSFAYLSQADCSTLLHSARALPYRPAKRYVGEGEKAVHQDFELCWEVPEKSSIMTFARDLDAKLNQALAQMSDPPLARPFPLNDVIVQRYPKASEGIGSHRDHVTYRGLVILLTISGQARLFVSSERNGGEVEEIDISPGRLIFMKAPDFDGEKTRPFHFLKEISQERISLGLRMDRARL